MKILPMVLVIVLCSCESGGGYSPSTYILYGDSRCTRNIYVLSKDCRGGRKLIDLESLDFGYDQVIIHLGYNDLFAVDAETWGNHLAWLIAGNEHKTWCVLPTSTTTKRPASKIEAFRQKMADVCTNTVDPQIEAFADDGVHYTDFNYRQVEWVIDGIREEL